MSSAKQQGSPPIVNRSAPSGTVVPVLVYEDVARAIDWLCGAFGFRDVSVRRDLKGESCMLSSRLAMEL